MTFLHRLLLSLATGSMLLSPAFAYACGGYDYKGDMGYMGTPVSAMGRYVFVNKVSRRVLREEVSIHQTLNRPRLARMEM